MVIIANPRAGHGKGAGNVERLRGEVRRRGLDGRVVVTEQPGHATEVARELVASGETRIATMGGDGTIGEVANALIDTGVELAVISMGTGNDVARSLGLPLNDLAAALMLAFDGEARPVDMGRDRDRAFLSVLGLGFPAVVAAEANRFTWLKGPPAFFAAVYKAIHRLRAVPLVIELDDLTLDMECAAVMIQNTPYTGGGLLMAPGARVDDGLLDVVIVDDIGKKDLMINFPKVYSGRHFEHPSFSLHRTTRVRIRSEERLPKMFDGDLCGWTPVEAEVCRGALRVVQPARD
ncbi:MAG TPA: diacylglycerol kinase family protein [Gemmatimonadota bacterium]|nr:diacylglycerol kinase family protein [Gemmatimonadota bacterium]